MLTKEFLELLEKNGKESLVFEFSKGHFIPMAYHITEVKNVKYESVDCGGFIHEDAYTLVQLWISQKEQSADYMKAEKALKIMNLVHQKKPLSPEVAILFEYGDESMPTAHFAPRNVKIEDGKLVLQLFAPAASCKPRELAVAQGKKASCC